MSLQNEISTDWINSSTIFYNLDLNTHSHCIEDVIDFSRFEWDTEGLQSFFDFGYSVFGHTPIKNVRYLQPDETIQIQHGKLIIKKNNSLDALYESIDDRTHPQNVLSMIEDTVANTLKSVDGTLLIPLSGGYDSRILAYFSKSFPKLIARTYGISENQRDSSEVTRASYLSKKLSLNWKQVQLNNFNKYLDEYVNIFGPSTHAHGMYQYEFYTKILDEEVIKPTHLLSGIIGDIWAGNVYIEPISGPSDLINLSRNHSMSARSQFLNKKSLNLHLYENYWEQEKHRLSNPRWRIICSTHLKMILLKYLLYLPKSLGLETHAPFLNKDIALGMLCLDDSLRENRIWQQTFLDSIGLLNIDQRIPNNSNVLDTHGLKHHCPPPLSKKLLSEIIEPVYIDWINKNLLNNMHSMFRHYAVTKGRPKRLVQRLKITDPHLEAYYAYLTIYPLEQLIKKRIMRIGA